MIQVNLRTLALCAATGLFVSIAGPTPATAAPLLSVGAARGAGPGLALEVDRDELRRLRARPATTVGDFPLASGRQARLELERFRPFSGDARALVMTESGERDMPWPDRVYFRGKVQGEPNSVALLVVGPDFVRGFVETGGDVHRFGPDAQSRHRIYSTRETLPVEGLPPLCSGDLMPLEDAVPLENDRGEDLGLASWSIPEATSAVGPFGPALLVQPYIETDQELLTHFPDTTAAMDYLADLAAAVSAIFDAASSIRIVFAGVRLWETTDPYSATSTGGMLSEVANRWKKKESGTSRDFVHFISGKTVVGGRAYLGAICSQTYGYAVSTVFGSVDPSDPYHVWDIKVFAHETGHILGSGHTHCYSPPIDNCYAAEAGCYAGSVSVPPGGGTIMSYCHTLPGGLDNINLAFDSRVGTRIRAVAEAYWCRTGFCIPQEAFCVDLPCGDGILDDGEECDDGNQEDGDCCSSQCTLEPQGASCSDGDACTTGDACNLGACEGTAIPEGGACDDGTLCTSATCSAGVCQGVVAPATGCRATLAAGGSKLILKADPDASRDRLLWKWGRGEESPMAALGSPATSDDFELCLYNAAGDEVLMGARAPAGGTCGDVPCWKALSTGYKYVDREATPGGVAKAKFKAGGPGRAVMLFSGKGAALGVPPLGGLPSPLRAQLRSGHGECWEAVYSSPKKHTASMFKALSD